MINQTIKVAEQGNVEAQYELKKASNPVKISKKTWSKPPGVEHINAFRCVHSFFRFRPCFLPETRYNIHRE